MERTSRLLVPSLACALLALATPARAADFGVRGGVYAFDGGPDKAFVGAELLLHAGDGIYFNPNAEYVFVDDGRFWTFNFDAHWDLPTHGTPFVWLGAGLAVVYVDPEVAASSTEAHANLLAGIGFRTSARVVPYIQLKLITGDPVTYVAAGGIRF